MSEAERPGNDNSPFAYRPEAAAAYDGDHECQYGDCDAEAEWVVEWKASGYTGGKVSLMCRSCSKDNRVYVEENNLHVQPISEKGYDELPAEVVADVEVDG